MNVYDLLYGIGLFGSAPVWAARSSSRTKVMSALRQRMGQVEPRQSDRPAVWIHAVSLGEVNAARALIDGLLKDPLQLDVILSTTTTTGHDRSVALYSANPRVSVVRYPLDFSSAIRRSLDALRPSAVVLMELETWPNFILQCHSRSIPVFVVNGRVTESSFRKYRWVKPIIARMLSRLRMICAQDALYAERFMALGAPRQAVQVTGTMKYDTADVTDAVSGADSLASELSLNGEDPVWVCGSTGPGEEALLLSVYRTLLSKFPHLRLVLVPRKPERFDEVEEIIRANEMNVIRRSEGINTSQRQAIEGYCVPPVILGDTMGELRKFYSLATVVFVGRSLVDLGSRQHGSDMLEPAALGKPCIVGPFTGNFDEAVRSLKAGQGIIEIQTPAELETAVSQLLKSPSQASDMGRRAQAVVQAGKGATARHLAIITRALPESPG